MLSGTVPTLASLDIKGHRMTEPSASWQLDGITYSGGTQDGPRAGVTLSRPEQQVHAEGSGTGLIDAVCHAISRATGVQARVVAFRAYSAGPGSEAVGEVELEVELPGRRVTAGAAPLPAPGSSLIMMTAMVPPWSFPETAIASRPASPSTRRRRSDR
jgi:hypothetical protein